MEQYALDIIAATAERDRRRLVFLCCTLAAALVLAVFKGKE